VEVDERDVLAKYVATVSARQTLFCNETELPYPRDIIKTVLKGALGRAGNDADARRRLYALYVGLADFQPVSPAEQLALSEFDRAVSSNDASSDNARIIASIGALHAAIANRVALAAEALWGELRELEDLNSGQ
jgi:hypothetical protein